MASIIEHTLTTLKALKPNRSQVYLRSDNAGCYQVDLGWALRKTRKAVAFFHRAKNYLADVFWTGEETGKKATASDMAPKMKSSRDDTGQKMFSKTDWLTEQQIARYFSRLSALTRTGLLQRSPSVSMTEDEEADADELALEVNTDRTRQK